MNTAKQKGFISVVKELENYMIAHDLSAGDKLPSERDLSEKMNISRSSIREALRAMELIGIITTKRGEGTFLSNVDDHQLFEIIGRFLIYSEKQKNEITEFKQLLEGFISQHGEKNRIIFRVYRLIKRYDKVFSGKGSKHD
ncbi:FadR/GntR family transcriptional regulator [Macrococcus brunensis]|uniref:FadR/GntR family transcriptional regulator n=1 Tax=Macrococcus brunensis TaxID=198483 RepID=UPI001EF00F29|nr:GntR family transcriptional regulator [Macrococcus brunensis]ULG71309.1 GntR family transcriptional regulator [Macrococcus brunensis]ULG73615.1 GntR family transcriptional regulator [Macrococcus brunensis]